MTSGPGGGDVVEVHLLRLPVSLWARTQEHADGLLREFALIAEAQPAGECPTIPRRLSLLVEELNAQYSSITTEQEAILANALNGGLAEIDDLAFRVPIDTSSASVHLDELLDEADRYCLAGEHLLTFASPPDQIAFRKWYLGEFVSQIEGRAPLAWPDFHL